MILRHITTKENLKLILECGYLTSRKSAGKEKGRIYFEEYRGNNYLLEYMLKDNKYQNMSRESFISLEFESDDLIKNGINFIKSTDYTKSETLIFVGDIYTKEQQEQIGDYYIVTNQNISIDLCKNKEGLESKE